MKKNYRSPRNKEESNNDNTNVVTKEAKDALILSIDSPIDSWVTDLRASFRNAAHHEITKNYVAENHGKVTDREPMNIVGIDDVSMRMPNHLGE